MAGNPVSSSAGKGGNSGTSSSGSGNLPGDAGAGSDGAAGTLDGGQPQRDAGTPDGALVGRLSSRGCSCKLGQTESSNASLIWILLSVSGLAWRARRRH